ncbi:Pol polyprotein [Plakobranchus ocellatus]|uniref:Pol polyprotein n=1 Tax=Plakobranchus ocellatus TaxID=259542 RepID=A0AAV3YBQ3_9GAST|nr:Pol polyprotein [Plakobranchus ocellatus]
MSQPQGESTQALLAALTSQLQSMTVQPNISAVSLKLPDFWTTSPEVWFARVEAQFGTKNISTDQTKYDYVVSALDVKTAEEVQDVLVNPPDANKYSVLKRALLKAFGKSQAQRDNELLNLNGLGDRKPTALLRKINALNEDPQSLKRALFLSNLPADIRSILAGQNFNDIQKLAEAADRIWETRGACVQQVIHTADSSPPAPVTIEAVSRPRFQPQRRPGSKAPSTQAVCYYHLKFGPQARRCQPGCKFSSLQPSGNDNASVAAAGNPHQPNTFSVVDRLSGRSYLVDTGAEVSVYPASVQERKSQPPSSTLTAANGTSIHTWGKRKVFLAIGQKGQYKHEFYLADVTRPILGADFFIKHGLAIDLRGKRLLSIDNMSILLRETKSPLTLSGLGFPLKHEYDSLLQQFPELLTPHFHQCNNKHGVEHHIITQGPPTHSRARRLDQAKLSAAKAEFLQMEDMGIIRRSKKLSDAEKKYSAFDRELLASYSAVIHFRHFLEGRPFTLYTDHKPLTFALSSETDRSPRQTRHLAFIAEFTTDIRHIKGKFNVVTDALSRITTTSNAADTINLCPVSISHPVEVDWIDFAQLAKDQIQSGEMASYRTATTGLILKDIDIGPSTLFCDTSLGVTRPVLPVSWTRPVFNKIHGLSHPGVRPTQKAIAQRFVWHGMKRDIRQWCKECPDCQASKIHRHTHSALTKRPQPSDRFRSLHVDLVGPLPESHGMTYLFTVIDRFTRWPEAVPLPDAQASTCATALLHHWVARFGVPEDIHVTSDRGRQFTSALWTQLNSLLGINANTTTAYHPQANGMVERLHRQLKASLKARTTSSNWFDELPMVLLGIRSSWRVDPGCSPAELVYGSTLRIPGEFLQPHDARTVEPDLPFLRQLQQTMRSVQPPTPQFHGQPSVYVPANLAPAKFVYVRKDSHKHPLQRPYDGPYLVLNKSDKFFTVDIKGRPETRSISIDRLKAAFVTQLTTAGQKDPANVIVTSLRFTPPRFVDTAI